MHLYESHMDGCFLEDEYFEPQSCECGDTDRWICEIENELQLIANLEILECADWHIAELVNEYRDRNTKGHVDKIAVVSAMFRSKNIHLVDSEPVIQCFHPKSPVISYDHELSTRTKVDVIPVRLNKIRIIYGDKMILIGLAGKCSCGRIYFKEAK